MRFTSGPSIRRAGPDPGTSLAIISATRRGCQSTTLVDPSVVVTAALIHANLAHHHHYAKIQVKSVDTVENPGREHAAPVDNTSGTIVDSQSHLLESGALSGMWFMFLLLEKLLVRVPITSLQPYCGTPLDNGYPQSCQPFYWARSIACPEATPPDKLPTGPTASESKKWALDPVTLRVRWVFDVFRGKVVHSCGKHCG